jgi:protein arginine kinase activator
MKCETCAKGEATVAYTHIVDDTKKTFFLCEVCAEEKNIETAAPSEDKTKDVPVLAKEVKDELTNLAGAEDASSASCQACGMAYDEFKKAGRLGCTECYGAFAPQLEACSNASTVRRDTRARGRSRRGRNLRPNQHR